MHLPAGKGVAQSPAPSTPAALLPAIADSIPARPSGISHWTLAKTAGIPYIMQDEHFEWDDVKAAANLHDHGIAFDKAVKAFADSFALEWIDESEGYDEERCNLLGMCEGVILHVTYTERGERIRIISARRAERDEQDNYFRENAR